MAAESLLLWSAAAAITAAIFGGYLWRFRHRLAADAARHQEARRLGIDQPTAQYPYIDPAHCIGCGACVAACPEGDVLGVVGGTAVVINGLRCVGHGRCETACPVGAIEVGLGDMKSRKDVPQLGERYESSVPGVFVVGELGGLSLVRNAIAQGSEAGQEIVHRAAHQASEANEANEASGRLEDILDVAIVGAGPSGLAAAAVCSRAGLTHRVFEREDNLGGSLLHYPRRKMVLTQPVELPGWGALSKEEYSKEVLLETLETMMRDTDIQAAFGARVEAIETVETPRPHFLLRIAPREDGGTSGAQVHSARFVVLALGRRGSPRKLGVPGEELPKVMYRLVDAASYENRKVLVVGGGDSAVEAAIGLGKQQGNTVTLSYRREKIVRVKKKNQDALERSIAAGEIQPLYASQPTAIERDQVRLKLTDGATVAIPNDDVFIFAGGIPPFDLLQSLGIRFGG